MEGDANADFNAWVQQAADTLISVVCAWLLALSLSRSLCVCLSVCQTPTLTLPRNLPCYLLSTGAACGDEPRPRCAREEDRPARRSLTPSPVRERERSSRPRRSKEVQGGPRCSEGEEVRDPP